MIRATPHFRITPGTIPVLDFAAGSQHLSRLVQELEDIKRQHTEEHTRKMKELDDTIARASRMQKGDKGDKPIAGVDYPVPKDGKEPNEQKIIETISSRIRQPKDGETPIIDYQKVAKETAKLIPVPKDGKDGENGVAPTIKEITDHLKKNLKVEHITGLKAEIDSYRNQLAGKHYGRDTMIRGGGDTVTAGTNVTITTDVNGKKVIAASSAGNLNPQKPSGTINGVNKVFTCVGLVNAAFVDGSIDSAATITGAVNSSITYSVPPQNDVFAI